MPTATCFNPDGTPICHDNGKPLIYARPTAERARLSAVRSWWPGSQNGLCSKEVKDLDPRKLLPPVGSVIALDGVPSWRFERVPVFGQDGVTLTGTRLDWVDIAAQAVADEEARAMEEMRAKLAKQAKAPKGEK